MTIKTVAHFGTLMRFARELAEAKKSGDGERIRNAQKAHDEYKQLCLESDEMSTGFKKGDLE